jgi:hypothetical protein
LALPGRHVPEAGAPPEAAPGQTSFAAARLGMGLAGRDERRRPPPVAIDRTPGFALARSAARTTPPPQIRTHQPMASCSPSPDVLVSGRVVIRGATRGAAVAKQPNAQIDMAGACECGKQPNQAHGTRAFVLLRGCDHTMPAKGEEQSPELPVPAVRLRRPVPPRRQAQEQDAPRNRRARLQPAARTARP